MVTPKLISLANGSPLVVAEMPTMESMALGIFVDVGSRHDPAKLSGISHFAEHLFFKGTRKRNARQLSLEIETEGASADAFTSEEHTCFYVRGTAEQFEHLAEVLLDMFLSSTFPADEVERERGVISEEIAMYREQPSSRAEDMLCHLMWPKHPLGRPISGDDASLARIRREDLLKHTQQHYGRKNVVFSVAGNVTASRAVKTLEKLIGKRLAEGSKPRATPQPAKHFSKGPITKVEKRDVEQTQLALAYHAPGRGGRAPYTLKILNILAGENTSSRLWQEVREKRGWCYQIETEVNTLSDTGLFQIFAGIHPKNTAKALKIVSQQLTKLAEKPVPAAELQRAISYACGSGKLGLEGTANMMLWLGESLLFHEKVATVAEAQQRLRLVTGAQVCEMARRIFTPKRFGAAIVGPEDQAEMGI